MEPHFNPFPQRQFVLQPLRRHPVDLGTTCGMPGDKIVQPLLDGLAELHGCSRSSPVSFPNQFVSKQRRSAMRARCSITQRLLCEMFNSSQISLLSMSSTSRSRKTWATFFGSFPAHRLNTTQN